jgi:hypothetical protein
MQTKGGKGGEGGGRVYSVYSEVYILYILPCVCYYYGWGGGWEKRGRGGLERWGARERATESIV